MIKAVSYSLYGSDKRYTINALVNIDLCHKFYPDWEIHFYYDHSVPDIIINEIIKNKNCKIIKSQGFNHSRAWWRFLSYDISDLFISRDADSHITEREVDAVNEWVESGKSLHIMRDNVGHNRKIQSGMFGLRKNDKLISMKSLIGDRIKSIKHYGEDEAFLDNYVYPIFAPSKDFVVHDEFARKWGKDATHSYKKPIINEQFIGTPQFMQNIFINKDIADKYIGLY